jgi:hypothetical protein
MLGRVFKSHENLSFDMDGNSRTWELGQVFKSHEIFVDIKVTNFHPMGGFQKKTHDKVVAGPLLS